MSEKYDAMRAAAVTLLSYLGTITLPKEIATEAELLNQAINAHILEPEPPIAMRLTCPDCGQLHVDEGEFATKSHHTHACQSCGNVWRPAVVATVGVRFLPGFKNEEKP